MTPNYNEPTTLTAQITDIIRRVRVLETAPRVDPSKPVPLAKLEDVTFSAIGTLPVRAGTNTWYNDSRYTKIITKVRISVGTAPIGASLIIDVKRNDVTIFSDPATRPVCLSGQRTGVCFPDNILLRDGDYLSASIVQVGTTTAGSDLTVSIWMY